MNQISIEPSRHAETMITGSCAILFKTGGTKYEIVLTKSDEISGHNLHFCTPVLYGMPNIQRSRDQHRA